MRKVLSIVLITGLFGCVSTNPRDASIRPEQQAEYRQDLKGCEYEAKLHVREPQAVSKYSIMADYDMSEQRKDIVWACLEAKGWKFK